MPLESVISSDYLHIARAIACLRKSLSSGEVSDCCGLAESELRELFLRWSGVDPPQFTRYLSAGHIRQRLDDAARELLPGPWHGPGPRVRLSILTVDELRGSAATGDLRWGRVPTPFGAALLGFSSHGICHFSFVAQSTDTARSLPGQWPGVRWKEDAETARALAGGLFDQLPAGGQVPVRVTGSDFQVAVWRALLRVEFGQLCSYRQLAFLAGRPGAARAVGTALASNPVAWLIPCHRVVRGSGETGAYHWGSGRKAAMIGWEAAQLELAGAGVYSDAGGR